MSGTTLAATTTAPLAPTDLARLAHRAAAPLLDTLRTLDPAVLDAPTPCAGWDVRRLLGHLLFWGPPLAGAARKSPVSPPAASEDDVLVGVPDPAAALTACVQDVVTAWGEPTAWDSVTSLGGPPELPAPVIGGMVLGELVVHGWDLATAVGGTVTWDDDLLGFLHGAVVVTAEQGRELGVYGPAVPVAEDAPLLRRVLALTGRSPDGDPAPS